MSRKLLSVMICFILVFSFSTTALAHPGRTDANGGHYDRSTGIYHYHNGGGSSSSRSSSSSSSNKKSKSTKSKKKSTTSNRSNTTIVYTLEPTRKPTPRPTPTPTPTPKPTATPKPTPTPIPEYITVYGKWVKSPTFILPPDDIWGIPSPKLVEILGNACAYTKIGKRDALVVHNVKVASFSMNCYFVFGEKIGTYWGLSKITYVLPDADNLTKEDKNKGLEAVIEVVKTAAGKPKSSEKTTVKWSKKKYTITTGIGKFEKYTGSKATSIGIVLEWKRK